MNTLPHAADFVALTEYLLDHQVFWRESVFHNTDMPWRAQFPELSQALLSLSDQEFLTLDQAPDQLGDFLAEHILGYADGAARVKALVPSGISANAHNTMLEGVAAHTRLNVGVPGRKWQQINAFIAALNSGPKQAQRIVDWCSGKSHLGRAVAWGYQRNLHFIEYNAELCAEGLAAAQRCLGTHASISCECVDVLTQSIDFQTGDAVLALHACGDLHRTLIQQWANSPAEYLALAPCCYHQWLTGNYAPRSRLAQANDPGFSRNQIRVAVQEMVTSPVRVRRQADELKICRLAFDALQREVRGVNSYLPTPSLPASVLRLGHDAVIRLLAEKKALLLPDSLDTGPYLETARQRYRQVQRLNLATQGFRRAIECWLVMDLVLALEEAGARVQLQSFCDRQLTPRNLLITAMR